MGVFDIFKKKNNKVDITAYIDRLFNEGKYQETIKVIDIAIETEPTNWFLYFRKGKCFQFMNNFDIAIREYEKGVRFEDNFDLNRGMGECYLMTEQWFNGKNSFLKALRLLSDLEKNPSNKDKNEANFNNDKANISNNLAIAFYNLDEIEDAIQYSEMGIKFDPNFAGNYRILGIILLAYDRTRGVRLIKQAVSLGDEMAKEVLNDIV